MSRECFWFSFNTWSSKQFVEYSEGFFISVLAVEWRNTLVMLTWTTYYIIFRGLSYLKGHRILKRGFDGKQMLQVAGVQLPVRLRQQLEQERQAQAVEERAHRSPVASKVEDGPRLTHKLLRVGYLLPILMWFWHMPVAHRTNHGHRVE